MPARFGSRHAAAASQSPPRPLVLAARLGLGADSALHRRDIDPVLHLPPQRLPKLVCGDAKDVLRPGGQPDRRPEFVLPGGEHTQGPRGARHGRRPCRRLRRRPVGGVCRRRDPIGGVFRRWCPLDSARRRERRRRVGGGRRLDLAPPGSVAAAGPRQQRPQRGVQETNLLVHAGNLGSVLGAFRQQLLLCLGQSPQRRFLQLGQPAPRRLLHALLTRARGRPPRPASLPCGPCAACLLRREGGIALGLGVRTRRVGREVPRARPAAPAAIALRPRSGPIKNHGPSPGIPHTSGGGHACRSTWSGNGQRRWSTEVLAAGPGRPAAPEPRSTVLLPARLVQQLPVGRPTEAARLPTMQPCARMYYVPDTELQGGPVLPAVPRFGPATPSHTRSGANGGDSPTGSHDEKTRFLGRGKGPVVRAHLIWACSLCNNESVFIYVCSVSFWVFGTRLQRPLSSLGLTCSAGGLAAGRHGPSRGCECAARCGKRASSSATSVCWRYADQHCDDAEGERCGVLPRGATGGSCDWYRAREGA